MPFHPPSTCTRQRPGGMTPTLTCHPARSWANSSPRAGPEPSTNTNVATASYTGSSEWLSNATGCGLALGSCHTDTFSAWARRSTSLRVRRSWRALRRATTTDVTHPAAATKASPAIHQYPGTAQS